MKPTTLDEKVYIIIYNNIKYIVYYYIMIQHTGYNITYKFGPRPRPSGGEGESEGGRGPPPLAN